jgi:hypothetical protein
MERRADSDLGIDRVLPAAERIGPGGDLAPLLDEVYGDSLQDFLDTTRRTLGGLTPRQALIDGDAAAVRDIAVRDLQGDWS